MKKNIKKFFLFLVLITYIGFANIHANSNQEGHSKTTSNVCKWPIFKHIWNFFELCSSETDQSTLDLTNKDSQSKKENIDETLENEIKKTKNSIEKNFQKTKKSINELEESIKEESEMLDKKN